MDLDRAITDIVTGILGMPPYMYWFVGVAIPLFLLYAHDKFFKHNQTKPFVWVVVLGALSPLITAGILQFVTISNWGIEAIALRDVLPLFVELVIFVMIAAVYIPLDIVKALRGPRVHETPGEQ